MIEYTVAGSRRGTGDGDYQLHCPREPGAQMVVPSIQVAPLRFASQNCRSLVGLIRSNRPR
jgi:hypothetical protein